MPTQRNELPNELRAQECDTVFTTLALLPNGESHSLQAPAGWRLMEVLRDYGLPIRAECGGACSCATCHVTYSGAGTCATSCAGG